MFKFFSFHLNVFDQYLIRSYIINKDMFLTLTQISLKAKSINQELDIILQMQLVRSNYIHS